MKNYHRASISNLTIFIILFCLLACPIALSAKKKTCANKKILICGVCLNIESSAPNTIKNIEALGKCFKDNRVFIYENNSTDNTAKILAQWASENKKVTFLSETLPNDLLSTMCRTEKIARARNIVLDLVRQINYQDYKYLIMVDLDFQTDWPIDEIINTIESPIKWDCVSANGLDGDVYCDRYAYRGLDYPFGPELLGEVFWYDLGATWFSLKDKKWIPTYSAFGGLAIYKTLAIINSSYSGIVNSDLEVFYKKILAKLPQNNIHRQKYLGLIGMPCDSNMKTIPIKFQYNTPSHGPSHYISCCEHTPLHASMARQGFNKFYINPKMFMRY
jgi:hypothetical protein